MITALLIGLVKTIGNLFWLLLNSLLSFVFSNYNATLNAVIGTEAFQIAGGIIDIMFGFNYFYSWIGFAITTLITTSLAKKIIGFFTKG